MFRKLKTHRSLVVALALAIAIPLVAFAGGKASTASNGMLNHQFRTTSYTAPSNTYVGLFSTCPTTGNNGTELSGNGYYRSVAISKADASWNYTAATFISAATITNASTVTFPAVATSSWTVNCFGVYDQGGPASACVGSGNPWSCCTGAGAGATCGGNLLYWGSVTGAPVTVGVGVVASFAATALTITEN
jgi:hypothetical protein